MVVRQHIRGRTPALSTTPPPALLHRHGEPISPSLSRLPTSRLPQMLTITSSRTCRRHTRERIGIRKAERNSGGNIASKAVTEEWVGLRGLSAATWKETRAACSSMQRAACSEQRAAACSVQRAERPWQWRWDGTIHELRAGVLTSQQTTMGGLEDGFCILYTGTKLFCCCR